MKALQTQKMLLLFALSCAFGLSMASAQAEDRRLQGRLDLSDIVEYRAFEIYQEAPELAALVEAGRLPPVEERLPREPRVLLSAAMVDGPGVYGSVWRDTYAIATQSWNWGAGQTQGWFGINEAVQEGLVDLFPMYMMRNPEPAPRLARAWEWSEDGMSLTMNLIEGAHWSDGTPFTAEDVRFTFEDYILDPNVPSWVGPAAWTFNDEVTRLEVIDDYTIRFHFGAAFPRDVFYRMGYLNFSIVPMHVFSVFHPTYNEESSYAALLESAPPHDLPAVVLGAFVPVIHRPDEQLILVRNPYYWQVDEEGKQLPYLSEVWFSWGTSGQQRTFNLIADRGDVDTVENPQIFGMINEASRSPQAHFNLEFEEFRIGFRLVMNLHTDFGATSARERALREIFRNLTFRQALSHAVDRDGLATAAFPGPLTQAWYGGYQSGSIFYDEALVTRYSYDPERAQELLAELGFHDSDGNGLLNWPEGSAIAGDDLIIEVVVGDAAPAAVEAAQALVPLFREVGIDLRLRVLPSSTVLERMNAGTFDMAVLRISQTTPDVRPAEFGPATPDSPSWHKRGPDGRELLDFEQEMFDLFQEVQFTDDAERRSEILREILRLHTLNAYTIGLYESRAGLAYHRRLRNIPADLPTYMYEWGTPNMPQWAWTAEEEQIAPRFLDLIPTAEDYENRDWDR